MGIKDFVNQMASAVASPSGVAAFGTGIFNYLSQQSANTQNVAMMREQMRFNSAESEKQRRAAIEQWEREIAYNDPTSQVARLRAAGINPALAYSNGIDNTAAPSPSMSEAQSGGLARVTPYQIDPLTAAQIENIEADTEQKKGVTKGKEIENEVGRMNLNAFKQAYNDGLVDDAVRAGFQKDIIDSRMSRYSFLQSAWDFAVYTGFSLIESLTIGGDGSGAAEFGLISDLYSPSSHAYRTDDPRHPIYERFKQHSDLFSSNYEAQAEANRAAKKMAQLQMEENDKDFDIWKAINDAADNGETWAKVVRVGLWISNRFMKLPSFSLSIRGSDKSNHVDYSNRNTNINN